MTQDIIVLAVSIIYYALEYFFLQLHASDTAPLFILALCIDFLFFVYVLIRFFEKKISMVTVGTTVLPFFWIIKTALLKIPAFTLFSTIPDWTILLVVCTPYLYFLINTTGELRSGSKNLTQRTKLKKYSGDMGDYPIMITPDLIFPTHDRFTHTQVIGTTGSGKTRFIFYPWIYQDILHGAGLFILDIKSNMKDKIIKFVTDNDASRDLDFRCFSLGEKDSHTYNPLAGDDSEEIFNRVFATLYINSNENPYYLEIQQRFLHAAIAILHKAWGTLIFQDLYETAVNPEKYFKIICAKDPDNINSKDMLILLKKEDLHKCLEGLINKLSIFVTAKWAPQINSRNPDIDVADVILNNRILLFQVKSQKYEQSYKAITRLMMMHLAAEISKRYETKPEVPFFIYADEFYNILYPNFPDLINKAREAYVGIIFGHQSLGDLELNGKDGIKNIILSNSRNKVVLNIDDPVTAEYFAESWGTDTILVHHSSFSTKDGVREAGFANEKEEAFIAHPSDIKHIKLGKGYVKLETSEGKILHKVEEFKDINYNKIKTHKLNISHAISHKANTPEFDPHAAFKAEEKPQQSIKDKFSKKKTAEQVTKEMLEALKKDIPEEE